MDIKMTEITPQETVTETSTASAPHRTPTPELHATYTTFEILVALVAVVGNAMVIYVFRRERRLRRRTNYYIVSLAVADFLVGLLGIPFAILASVGLPRNLHACLFTVSLLVMLCTISIFCLVAVSVDRYWAILHPMCYSRNVRTRTAIVNFIKCGRGSSRGGGGSRGRSHSGWGSSHSSRGTSYSKPSYGWGSSSSSHSYPSSGSGLSGSGLSGSSSSSHNYPSSSSGLSGSGISSNSYPSWGLGGSSGSHNYPLSTGLSGSSSGYNVRGYPSQPTMYSGVNNYPISTSGSHSYPSGSTGLSGTNKNQQSSSGSHSYPSAPTSGLSGTNKPSSSYGTNNYPKSYDTSYRPKNTYNTNSGYGTWPHNNHGGYHTSPTVHHTTYYSSPQYVYVNEYRHSDSRYSDILTGLALYNLGRSHSYHDHHYYYDDYYRRRYEPSENGYSGGRHSGNRPSDEATCTLKITENGKLNVLRIPCEIVSTFSEGSKKVSPTVSNEVNTTICTSNTTVVNNNVSVNGSLGNSTIPTNAIVVNVTVCSINSKQNTTVLDPLTVKGPQVDPNSNMECVVEIRTKDAFLRNTVDCRTLIKYAKMPEPKKDNGILPERQQLKSWLVKPPWWMSIFVAV